MTVSLASPFAALGLSPSLVDAVALEGYLEPTPIQIQAVPHVLAGKDVLGCAQTGTGKTAAFVLPILQRLARTARHGKIRTLILTPTRELAAQIAERISVYGKGSGLTHTVVYGGVSQRAQEDALRRAPDILVATPGRLLDLMEQGYVRLDAIEIFVLDEADRMLDMGFIHDVRRVVQKLPQTRQTLFFSATMPNEIASLAGSILKDPVRVAVTPEATTAETVVQSVFFVPRTEKRALLEKLLRSEGIDRALVFTRTKHGANRVTEQLQRAGIESAVIHGNKSQGARERALEGFRRGTTRVLVATDIAARGIDVDGVSHVFNYELPNVPESYVHRIGRTGRAGASGKAISFCDSEERPFLEGIERLLRFRLPVMGGDRGIERPLGAPPGERPAQAVRPGDSNGGGRRPSAGRTRRFRGARQY
ncbi:MAG: ATP-dependent helicase RhlE [Myxococcaceae bacterium]|jgi:ATP-dependent RNA helicase RhlE|nr:ATP-dependent helicase RhlE [Myxococcaceae bacterium]